MGAAPDAPLPVLVVRSRNGPCALATADVGEVTRPLPLRTVEGAPDYVLGLALVRGEPTLVVHLDRLLGDADGGPVGRFVTLRSAGAPIALAVAGVDGVVRLPQPELQALPPLLEALRPMAAEALVVHERRLFAVLAAGRVIGGEVRAQLDRLRAPEGPAT